MIGTGPIPPLPLANASSRKLNATKLLLGYFAARGSWRTAVQLPLEDRQRDRAGREQQHSADGRWQPKG
jgi:hypothetical protein